MKKLFVILTISIQLMVSCDPIDDRLTIINNTNHDIVVGDRLWLSDTSMYLNNKIQVDQYEFSENTVESKNSLNMIVKGSWNTSFVNNNTMVLLLFNRDSIVKKRIKKPSENYDIEQIIYVSKDYVEKNDWKIVIDSNSHSKIVILK
jgi:hypothetical protein